MKGDARKKAIGLIKRRFPEVFLVSPYAMREDRKHALLECMEPNKQYTVEQLRREFENRFKAPITRVSINTYLNELTVEGRVTFKRQGRGGTKVISVV